MRSVPKYIFRDTDHVFRDTGSHIARRKASLQFYLLGYRAHSSPGHSMSFKENLFVATKHGRGKQQALGS